MDRSMKWPSELTLIRHGQSAYNANKDAKFADPLYQQFMNQYDLWVSAGMRIDPSRHAIHHLAQEVKRRYPVVYSDAETPLTDEGYAQARKTARSLKKSKQVRIPDVIYVSPYLRTMETYNEMCREWSPLLNSSVYVDERIREMGHGLSTLYGDRRVYDVLHPEQARLRKLEGSYYYKYPNGENVPDVIMRVRDWRRTLIREDAGKCVMVIAHHITLLAFRTDQERLGYNGFLNLDEKSKPVNCGVTIYDGLPGGRSGNGVLKIREYNTKHY